MQGLATHVDATETAPDQQWGWMGLGRIWRSADATILESRELHWRAGKTSLKGSTEETAVLVGFPCPMPSLAPLLGHIWCGNLMPMPWTAENISSTVGQSLFAGLQERRRSVLVVLPVPQPPARSCRLFFPRWPFSKTLRHLPASVSVYTGAA